MMDEVRCPSCTRYLGAFIGRIQCPSCKRWVQVDSTTKLDAQCDCMSGSRPGRRKVAVAQEGGVRP